MQSLQELTIFINKKITEKALFEKQLNLNIEEINNEKQYYHNLVKARWVISEVAKLTQQKVSKHIESLVTMAIQSVYQENFKLNCKFEIKRNKSECLLTVENSDGKEFIPKDEDGGGLLDVISLALRVVLWTMQNPRSDNVFILDEPGKFLGDLIEPFGQFIREIADKLKIQFIINTHDKRLEVFADKVWHVIKKNNISYITEK